VLLAFAAREPGQDLEGIPGFGVEGLRDPDARALLDSVVRWPVDEQVRERFLAETRGNPLALLELPRGLSPAELAGGFGLPQELSQDPSLAGRIRESFLRRVEALPEATRLLVLLAAAEPAGDPALLWRAAGRLGLARDAVASAEAEGLLKIGGRVVFRHPLVRSAVYGASSPADRRRVHVVLAEATDPDRDPDRRAWHLAHAAIGPDEEVAAELERSAARAQARGGLAAAAAFLDRAVQLSLDPAAQARRALAGAQAKYLAGAPEAARRLLSTAEDQGSGPLGELERSQVDMIRAQVAYSQNRGSDAPGLLLRAAGRLEPLDLRMARQTYLDAVLAGHFAGRLAPGSLREAAEAARRVPPVAGSAVAGPAASSDLLLDGLTTARWSAPTTRPSRSIVRRSSGSAGPVSARSWRAPIWFTASGCAGPTAAWTPVTNCSRRSRCSTAWGWTRFPGARGASWRLPGRRSGRRPPKGRTISPSRRRRSPGSHGKD